LLGALAPGYRICLSGGNRMIDVLRYGHRNENTV
jgi:hypothetical protein